MVGNGHTSNPSRKQRWACLSGNGKDRVVCYQTTRPDSPVPLTQAPGVTEDGPQVFHRRLPAHAKAFIITAAQNNTPAHPGFLAALEHAAKFYGAEIIAHAMRYKNPTTRAESADADNSDWWDARLTPYLSNTRLRLGKHISFLGDIRIQPTAVQPLTGLEGFTGAESTVVGHSKLALRVVPTPGHKLPKIMTTTGAVTVPNYSDTRAGAHGKFHHTLGAVLVQLDRDHFYVRHLLADSSGAFNDLEHRFTPGGRVKAPPPAALVLGDVHVDYVDPGVERATFGPHGLVETLRPQNIVYHDLLDGYAANPHHFGNPFNAVAKRKAGTDDVEAEVRRAITWAKNRTPPWARGWIVPSNHDRFLVRYLMNTDWRVDPTNAEFYLETALATVRSARMGPGGTEYRDPFVHWVERYKIPNVRCIDPDAGLRFVGVELGQHGDRGPNGARGTIRGFRRIGAKSVIGHSHTPGIEEGAYQAGTSSLLKLEYNRAGLSSWLHAHVIVHANTGKRQLAVFVNGKYRP